MEETIVKEWLRSLKLGQYSESFIDNGYDDLEICKQIDAPDLDAIGVVDTFHRAKLQQAVQILRVEGAASVYFTVEEVQSSRLEAPSRNSDPGPCSEIIRKHENGHNSAASTPGEGTHCLSANDDAYEAGRAELIRLPQIQLRNMLTENLFKDKVNLSIPPYTTKEGERGVLEGLASRYADTLNTHYQDVLDHLNFLRDQEWKQVASSIKANTIATSNGHSHRMDPELYPESWSPRSSSSSSLDHNDEHPIYLPGKYNPSSCLSDAEEDQIYGFTGINNPNIPSPGHGVCLNPRSQLIYEYPPIRVASGRSSHFGMKKRLGIGRLLKTLKRDLRRTSDSKSKNYLTHTLNISRPPQFKDTTSDLSSTPLVVLPGYSSPTSSHCSQSSRSHSSGQSFVIASASVSAPGTPGSSGPIRDSGLQQAIEKLKEQEIQRRREEQFREHEQVMHTLHQGLEQTKNLQNLQATYTPLSSCYESSYMYAEENASNDALKGQQAALVSGALYHHWYDEPPYESDPEDFLIGKDGSSRDHSPQHIRLSIDEDVISLKTAGDISIPRDLLNNGSRPSPRSQHGSSSSSKASTGAISHSTSQSRSHSAYINGHQKNSSNLTLVPSESRKCGLKNPTSVNTFHYPYLDKRLEKTSSGSLDIQSVSSGISNLSVENCSSESTNFYTSKHLRRSSASEGGNSGSQSDYEDEKRDSASLVGRMRVLHRDMQKKILRLKATREASISEAAAASVVPPLRAHNSRLEFPSSVYNCYQRQSSLPVKLKQDSRSLQGGGLPSRDRVALPIIGRARALVDYTPSPYDKDALKFKKGDSIDILTKNPSGIWKGHLHGVIGHFKFILVEEEPDERIANPNADSYWYSNGSSHIPPWIQKPMSLQTLLASFHLSHLTQVFVLNGFESLEDFRDLRPEDLDHMGITDTESRAKLIAAVGLILDSEEASCGWMEPASFIRHTTERITLPPAASSSSIVSSLPYYQTLLPYPEEISPNLHCQIYENTPYLSIRDENNLNTQPTLASVGGSTYRSRPSYNIPMTRLPAADALSTGGSSSALSPSSSSASSTFSSKGMGMGGHLGAVGVPPRSLQHEGRPSSSFSSSGISSLAESQKDSYHAQVVRVNSPTEPLPHLKSTTC